MPEISIKELHANTGKLVRKAGKSRTPVAVTDRGKVVALLISPHSAPKTARLRTLLPEYEALLEDPPSKDVLEDLDAVRGERQAP